jgi:peptidoglycan/xylan/chitin deacetylase (PgdA/CDA1 family)
MRPAVRNAGKLARPLALAGRELFVRRPQLTVLGWHRLDDTGRPLSTPPVVFAAQLDELARRGLPVLSLADALDRLSTGTLQRDAVVLTFDDGYASVLEVGWPQLRARGLPATLFVVTDYLDGRRVLPWDAAEAGAEHTRLATADEVLAAAAEGLDIGSHTATHPWLPQLSQREVERELRASRDAVESLLGRAVPSVAYPMGGWNRAVRDAAGAAGYASGITVDRGRNPARQHPLALRRAFAPPTVEEFSLLLDGAFTWLRLYDRVATRNGPPS